MPSDIVDASDGYMQALAQEGQYEDFKLGPEYAEALCEEIASLNGALYWLQRVDRGAEVDLVTTSP